METWCHFILFKWLPITSQNKGKILNTATNPCMSWSLPSSLTTSRIVLPTHGLQALCLLPCAQRSHAAPCLWVFAYAVPPPETFRLPPVKRVFMLHISAQMSLPQGNLLQLTPWNRAGHLWIITWHWISSLHITSLLIKIVYSCGISSASPPGSIALHHLSKA